MSSPSDTIDPLDAVVADYLQKVEAGVPPDREALLAANPESSERLRAFFADVDRMGSRGEDFRLPDIALPEDIGDYEFLGEIGRGGMGVVYRVRQKSLDRVVALKMILAGPLATRPPCAGSTTKPQPSRVLTTRASCRATRSGSTAGCRTSRWR